MGTAAGDFVPGQDQKLRANLERRVGGDADAARFVARSTGDYVELHVIDERDREVRRPGAQQGGCFGAPLTGATSPVSGWNAAEFARINRVLLLRASSGVGLDIALAGLAFEEGVVERASSFTYPPDISLRTCSAEDLIVLKAFADRPKDWMDI